MAETNAQLTADLQVLRSTQYSIANVLQLMRTFATITYSASMTPNLAQGSNQVITVTDGNAFTINAPTNVTAIQPMWWLRITNSSGGALGAISWDPSFDVGTVTAPANGKSVWLTFKWDGTTHWKIAEADAL